MRIAASVVAALCAGAAQAQNWTGATSNDWTVGSNWSPTTTPPAGSPAIIDTTSPNPTVLGVGGAVTATTTTTFIGRTGTANLTIQNGSTLTSTATGILLSIGEQAGSNGTVTVTGMGSQWTTAGSALIVGANGAGTLNIQNGGKAVTQNGIVLGRFSGAGTLNITGGTLETTSLARGSSGTGQANFDNAILRARASNAASFITGFTAGQLNIAAGGLTIDTAGFNVGATTAAIFSGSGGLTVSGGGALTLRGDQTFTGATAAWTV
jgi:fibronectin-binding autotransporter adhesin